MTTKTTTTVMELGDLAERLPYPLGLKLQAIRAEARERAEAGGGPNLAFTVAAFNGLAVRLAALISVQAYVRAGAADNAVNQALVDKLRQPSDGAWREVAGAILGLARVKADPHAAKVIAWLGASAAVPESGAGWETAAFAVSQRVTTFFEPPPEPVDGKKRKQQQKTPLPRAGERGGAKGNTVDGAIADLISLRNSLVHGEPPTDEALDLALLRVEAIARGFEAAFGEAGLYVRDGDRAWRVMGHVPQPLERAPDGVEDGVPTLVFEDGTAPLALAPLLSFRPGTRGEVDVDELFFVNAAALERLQYVGFRAGAHADGKELGTYEAFRAFWQKIPVTPSPKDPRIAYDELGAFHAQYFVGRGEVLEEIAGHLAKGPEEPGRYVELRALAGMGKTAVMAQLWSRHKASEAGDRPEGGPKGAWAFHFCAQTEGREYALVALRSIVAQLCDAVGVKREAWLSNDLKELKDERLKGLLAEVVKRAGTCVLVIDALDESTGSDEDALAGCLPDFLPAGVTAIISWRVDAQNKASRVDRQLGRIPGDRRVTLTTANPLAGLEREHVEAFLAKVRADATASEAPLTAEGDPAAERDAATDEAPAGTASAAAVPSQTVEAVWASATRDTRGADPFFLRFVAEGVREGRVDLERAETVPASLEDAFEGQWLSLPADRGLLAQRVLLLLGILREYGDDELLSELIARDPLYAADPDALSPLTPDDIARVRQKLGKLLVYDGERYGLFHDRFRRFLVGEQKDPIAEALGEL